MAGTFILTGAELGDLYTGIGFVQDEEARRRIKDTREWFQHICDRYWHPFRITEADLAAYRREEYRTQVHALVPALGQFEENARKLALTFARSRTQHPDAVRNAALAALAQNMLGDEVNLPAERRVITWKRPAGDALRFGQV